MMEDGVGSGNFTVAAAALTKVVARGGFAFRVRSFSEEELLLLMICSSVSHSFTIAFARKWNSKRRPESKVQENRGAPGSPDRVARLHSAADLILASHVGVIMGYVPPSNLLLRHVTAGSTASMSVSRHGLGTIIRELRRDLQVGYSPEEAARSCTSTFLSLLGSFDPTSSELPLATLASKERRVMGGLTQSP